MIFWRSWSKYSHLKAKLGVMHSVIRDSAAAEIAQEQDLYGVEWTVTRRDGSVVLLRASSAWVSPKPRGISGSMADSFCCIIWKRALKLDGSTHVLEGAGRERQGALGYCVISYLESRSRF
jgi:hypothetical protein